MNAKPELFELRPRRLDLPLELRIDLSDELCHPR